MASGQMREQTFLVLLALVPGPLHGYGIISSVVDLSDGQMRLGAGTLYGALDRLRSEGSIEADHDEVVDGRLRRYYRLSDAGRRMVSDEAQRRAVLADRARERLDIHGWAGA